MNARIHAEEIRARLGNDLLHLIDELLVLRRVDSTNDYLMRHPPPRVGCFRVAIAEHQTAGRGQFANTWESPPGTGLCMSIAYTPSAALPDLPALSLVLGMSTAQALRRLGIEDASVKWPNDIIAGEGKLGGILTESRSGACATVVAGTGINIDLRGSLDHLLDGSSIGRIVDIRQCLGNAIPASTLAGAVIDAQLHGMQSFGAHGFAAFHGSWDGVDWLRDRVVRIGGRSADLTGIASGVDRNGALLVKTDHSLHTVTSGSVRAAPASEGAA